ncbi:alpha/beta fold hydrolase [Kitasatospora sp. NPDC096147]|uniref:alpha/beta fold hydrolase n=1 Tax=Kitasatospora sp. NPDC096147 TaxID=3364093 RepID=UPI0038177B05
MTISHDITGGAGPSVLLLHSTVCDRRMWDGQVAALAEAGHRVVRADLRGYGESPAADRPYNDADDVAELLASLGIDRVALVGASGGGAVALEFAARFPERVGALGLLCTAAAGLEPGDGLQAFWGKENELLEAGDVAGATELNVTTWLGPEAGPEVRGTVRQMQQHAFEVQLAAGDVEGVEYEADPAAVTAPTLLVTGAHDFPEFTAVSDRLAGLIPGARRLHLDWAGHLPALERPEETAALLVDFLAESGWTARG